jgi:ribonuclease D
VKLDALFDFLDNPDQVVVLHAARQDLEIFYYLSGRLPKNIYDTQIAANFLGLGEQVAYKTLVQKYCNADVSKAQQFTDWTRRPLRKEQLEYALSDVTYLAQIYKALSADLEEKGRSSWLKGEMADLVEEDLYDIDPQNCWQRVKIRSNKGRDLIVLKELAAWREVEAKKRNVPRGRVLKDEALSQIAMIQPKSENQLGEIRFFGSGRAKSDEGQKILRIVDNALKIPKSEWPQKERKMPLSSEKAAALELLKMLLRVIAAEHHISGKMVASMDDLESLAKYGQKAEIKAMRGWRYEIYGQEALALMDGTLALALKNGSIERLQL